MHESSGSLLVSLAVMDASAALAELVGLSTQVVEAVIVGTDGAVEAAHAAGEERAQALAEAGGSLLAAAAAIRPSAPPVERVHVDLERGSLVVVRDAGRSIVATTVAEPTAGLVAFDLRAALRRLREASA
jgi:predicted regulator of Ras-like GTPase activity (Roadblock/LC7/MglB family)